MIEWIGFRDQAKQMISEGFRPLDIETNYLSFSRRRLLMKHSYKKATAAVMASLMAFSLTAVAGATEAKAEEGDKLKLVLCIGRKNDLSFQQSAYEGVMRVQEELGDKFDVEVVEMGDDTTKWEAAFYDAADNGADFIVGTGFQNKENFETIPLDYPDTKFILFDQDVDYSSGDLENVLTVLFDSNQFRFPGRCCSSILHRE